MNNKQQCNVRENKNLKDKMAFSDGFMIVFVAIFLLLFIIILLLRFAKHGSVLGSLAQTFQGGITIIDKAGTGDVAELVDFDRNDATGKIRLFVNFVDKFTEGQTGFVFEDTDFYPPLQLIDWHHYNGTIILYKDFEGRTEYRDSATMNLTTQIQQLKRQNIIYKRMGIDILQVFEGTKIKEEKENQNLHQAKMLKSIKSLVSETNVEEVSGSEESEGGMFD